MENNIGDARREYAARNGKFTQGDAASYFGVSESTYKKWEQGQGMLNGTQLRALASKYGVTVDYLLKMDERRMRVRDNNWTEGETELIELFRSMDAHGREQLLVFARGCAASYPLNKADSLGA